ncbi:protein of unknown function [Methylorubrum extorquens]|uniref:Uncharacterized protein n=1 Tax=Methylorubrum extorquens TaxID=408 RepID=A0A2N9AYU0_METEX|nr:protein of unknown function [Methylorubrum extorquens]
MAPQKAARRGLWLSPANKRSTDGGTAPGDRTPAAPARSSGLPFVPTRLISNPAVPFDQARTPTSHQLAKGINLRGEYTLHIFPEKVSQLRWT